MKNILKNILTAIISYEASLVLKKYNPKIIAVTGSVGKTSTKDAIYSVISKVYSTRRSEKSFNSEIGVPLTILGCQNGWNNPIIWLENIWQGISLICLKHNYPDWLVLEVGADHPGDIRNLTKWLKPNITVLTKFAKTPVHIEFFKNRDEIIKEKGYLVGALKHDGIIVLNADDNDAMTFKGKDNHKTLTYGVESEANIRATYDDLYYENYKLIGTQFKADYQGSSVPVIIKNTVGNQTIYSSLAALTVGVACGLNLVQASEGLADYVSPKGRMKLIPGIKDSLVIDDTYNSSPVALHSALETLGKIKVAPSVRKIVIFGDMLELGKHSTEEHQEVGKAVTKVANLFVTVGMRMRLAAETALDFGLKDEQILQFDNSKEAGAYVQNLVNPGDIVLVKGSQSMRMERCVLEIMSEPEKAKDLLVRQEEEWLAR